MSMLLESKDIAALTQLDV